MPEFASPDIWIKGGLVAPAHRKAMGVSVWVYLYVLGLVRFDGPEAGRTPKDKPYRHTEAAEALGMDVRSVKREFEHLVTAGYLATTRTQYGLHVVVSKYVAQAERSRRRATRSDESVPSRPTPEGAVLSTRSDESVQQKGQFCPPEVSETPLPINKVLPSDQATKLPSDTRVRAAPKPSGGVSLTPLADAFIALGLKFPGCKGREVQAAQDLLKQGTPEEIAACWQQVAAGEYGDPDGWMQRNLSFSTLFDRNRFGNWQGIRRGEYGPPPTKQVGAAKPTKPPPRNEPSPLPGPISYPTPEERAERDKRLRAHSNGVAPLPVRDDPARRREAEQRLLAAGKLTPDELRAASVPWRKGAE